MSERHPEPPLAGDEIDSVLGSLERQRATFLWKCSGLDAAGMNTRVGASSLTLGGLVKHMALVEDHNISRKFLDEPLGPPWDTVDWDADPDWEFDSAAQDSPEELLALWHAAADRCRAQIDGILATGGLDQLSRRDHPDGKKASLRRLLLDLVEEYSRHVGQADLIREAVDGLVGEDPTPNPYEHHRPRPPVPVPGGPAGEPERRSAEQPAGKQKGMSEATRTRWEQRTRVPLVIAALLFLGAYAWPILQPGLAHDARVACHWIVLGVWALFAVDFTIRICRAENRTRFLRKNWLDLLVLALPMLRPLQALLVLGALNMLAKRGAAFVRGRVVASVVLAVTAVSFVAALAMLDAERSNPDANIKDFGDAAWWAAVTIPTVGYGDRYPTTTEGRFISLGLMLTGIALLGVITAAIASWFVERMSEASAGLQATQEDIAEVLAEVQALREELRRRDDSHVGVPSTRGGRLN